METLINYYIKDAGNAGLHELIRLLQKCSAHVQASLIRGDYKKVKKQFKTDGKHTALNTQTALEVIHSQIDTAIRGQAGDALQKTVDDNVLKYEKIF